MTALGLLVAAAWAAVAAPAGWSQDAPEGVDEYPFLESLPEAREAARDAGKPLLVMFRCPP